MEGRNILQAFVDKVAYKLLKLPPNKVIHSVRNELQLKRTESPDVVFASRSSFKLPSDWDETCSTIIESTLPILDSNGCKTDGLNYINYSKLDTLVVDERAFQISEELASLPDESREWPLSVDRCTFHNHKVLVFLNRRKGLSTLLPHIIRQGCMYGRCSVKRGKVVLSCENLPESQDDLDLRQLRLRYVDGVLRNLLEANGYDVLGCGDSSSDGTLHLHLAVRPSMQQSTDCRVLSPGVVTCRLSGEKLDLSASDFWRHRLKDMRQLAEVKFADQETVPARDECLSCLADAVARMELLQVKPCYSVPVDLYSNPEDNPQIRGALFALYNYTRVATILRLFADKVQEGLYPPLVPVEEVDFSLLVKQDEWYLFRYLLLFPHVVESCISGLRTQSINPQRICVYLCEISKVYSGYYRRVRILTEPLDHMLPVMFARLHLLRAVEQVFRNAFSLLDITPLQHM